VARAERSIGPVHLTEARLEELRRRYGEPAALDWSGEISAREHALATYDPARTHDVTLFILNGARLALIRKPSYASGIWRPPGGGIHEGEEFEAGAEREAFEETGLRVRLERYLVATMARFAHEPYDVTWRTHVFLATTDDQDLAPQDAKEIAGARWGTLDELAGPLRERLLATGTAFWRYRAELHDAAIAAIRAAQPSASE
jgi:8-oxo-dGTP pyrophosphatase MutT (NUDIX family)